MPKELTRVDPQHVVALLRSATVSDETTDRILAVAGPMLLRHGLAAFEVDDVAVRAGVGRSTVYRRFSDRNGLIAAALAHEGRRLLTDLADGFDAVGDPVEQIVDAFCTGLRLARAGGLGELVRTDPVLLRLLSVDGGPVLASARDHLVDLARQRLPGLDPVDASRRAELLVRLAISFLVMPSSVLEVDGELPEDVVRQHVAPLLGRQPSNVVAAPTS